VSGLDWAMLPLQNYFGFHGRAPRAEYWWFCLLNIALSLFALAADLAFGLLEDGAPITVGTMVSLALFIPSLAVTVRRFHDINMSGWYCLLPLVPFLFLIGFILTPAGWFVMLVGGATVSAVLVGLVFLATLFKFIGHMATEGNRGPNNYGPSPYGFNYGV
jgi:uncharacterized membrane protein YhaH (DUF805 family)